jgi:mannosyltransferase
LVCTPDQTGQQDLRHIEVVTPNLSFRFSGVSSTIIALLPAMSRQLKIAALSAHIPGELPHVRWRDILRCGWTPPAGRPFRIWHARGNHDMIAGIALTRVLRQPWRLVFTSAGQRRHTRFTRLLVRRMDELISTSAASAAYLDRPSTVILHGVDTERFTPAADRDAAWRALGLPGKFGIGIFGRIRPQKGTDLFVGAMAQLLPHHPDWTAVIIGSNVGRDETFRRDLERRIGVAELSHRIFFLGQRPVAEIPKWYRSLSIVVAPPRWEGFGLVPLEAMASGTPIVASQAGAHEYVLDDPTIGRLVPADNSPALVAAIGDIMDMTGPEREAIGRAGRVRAENHFSIAREAAAIAAVYDLLWRAGVQGSQPTAAVQK